MDRFVIRNATNKVLVGRAESAKIQPLQSELGNVTRVVDKPTVAPANSDCTDSAETGLFTLCLHKRLSL